jgi:hypothetical protein
MTIAELNNKVQFVTDVTGKRQAVLLELALWEEVLATLEKLEDEADERRWDELFAKSPDVLARLADEARAEWQAGRTRELDPDLL